MTPVAIGNDSRPPAEDPTPDARSVSISAEQHYPRTHAYGIIITKREVQFITI